MSYTCCEAATPGTGSGKLQSSPRFAWWCCFGTKVNSLLLHMTWLAKCDMMCSDYQLTSLFAVGCNQVAMACQLNFLIGFVQVGQTNPTLCVSWKCVWLDLWGFI
jgi:hypothetical protein